MGYDPEYYSRPRTELQPQSPSPEKVSRYVDTIPIICNGERVYDAVITFRNVKDPLQIRQALSVHATNMMLNPATSAAIERVAIFLKKHWVVVDYQNSDPKLNELLSKNLFAEYNVLKIKIFKMLMQDVPVVENPPVSRTVREDTIVDAVKHRQLVPEQRHQEVPDALTPDVTEYMPANLSNENDKEPEEGE